VSALCVLAPCPCFPRLAVVQKLLLACATNRHMLQCALLLQSGSVVECVACNCIACCKPWHVLLPSNQQSFSIFRVSALIYHHIPDQIPLAIGLKASRERECTSLRNPIASNTYACVRPEQWS